MRKILYVYSLRITVLYFLTGVVWIFASDYLLEIFTSSKAILSELQTYKGWFYVTVTSFLLYILTSRYESRLKKNIRRLKHANEDLMTFLYKASHDLKGPISSILGLTNLFKMEYPEHRESAIIYKIESSARRSDFITQDLVRLADLIEKKPSYSLVPINQMIDELLDQRIHDHLSVKDVVIKRKLEIEKIIVDKFFLGIALEKIFENALKYQNPNAHKKSISVKVYKTASEVVFEIEDNGQGIPSEEVAKVFDMFHRASEFSTGSGLGLYIAKIAVEKLNGKINIMSALTKGTRLTITLPAKPHPSRHNYSKSGGGRSSSGS